MVARLSAELTRAFTELAEKKKISEDESAGSLLEFRCQLTRKPTIFDSSSP